MATTLDVTTQGGWHHFTATFTTEDQAIAYIKARPDTHIVREIEEPERAIPESWTRLLDLLYPTCHHGMDARMCMDPIGPHHFGTREWEMAQYGE